MKGPTPLPGSPPDDSQVAYPGSSLALGRDLEIVGTPGVGEAPGKEGRRAGFQNSFYQGGAPDKPRLLPWTVKGALSSWASQGCACSCACVCEREKRFGGTPLREIMCVHTYAQRSVGLFSSDHQAPKSHAILRQKPHFPSSNCHLVVSGPTPIPSHFPISLMGTDTGSPASTCVAHFHLLPGTTRPARPPKWLRPYLACLGSCHL